MYQAVLRPNLTKKLELEVSQIAKKKFSLATKIIDHMWSKDKEMGKYMYLLIKIRKMN